MENSSAYQDIPNLSEISSRGGLKFLRLNVCPLLPKTDKIRLLLQRYKNTDCFSVTETHLSAQVSDDEIGIQGYTIYRLDQQAHTKGGGVAVYVCDCLSVSRRYDLEQESVERIWLQILITNSTNILFGILYRLYRPPVGSQFISADFNTKLEESLSLAIAENNVEILLVGDLIKPANGKRFSSLIAAEEER